MDRRPRFPSKAALLLLTFALTQATVIQVYDCAATQLRVAASLMFDTLPTSVNQFAFYGWMQTSWSVGKFFNLGMAYEAKATSSTLLSTTAGDVSGFSLVLNQYYFMGVVYDGSVLTFLFKMFSSGSFVEVAKTGAFSLATLTTEFPGGQMTVADWVLVYGEARSAADLKTIALDREGSGVVTSNGCTFTCHPWCNTCYAASFASCNSCKGADINQITDVCRCSSGNGLTATGDACEACHPSCSTCYSASQSMCQDCKSPRVMATVAPGRCDCPAGYASNDATGDCDCADGFVKNGSTGNCDLCDLACAKCSSTSASGCTACKTNASLSATPGMCTCISGYSLEPATGNCKEIPPSSCPDGQYLDLISTSCQACHIACQTCTSSASTTCITCKSNAVLGNGVCTCADGFFGNPQACAACFANCAKCTGPSETQCTKTSLDDFTETVQVLDSSLPFLTPSHALICYRSPLPSNCGLFAYQSVRPSLGTDVSAWSLSLADCKNALDYEWPSVKTAYNSLFPTISFPNSDISKKKHAEATLKLWILHFGYYTMAKDSQWAAFVAAVNSWPAAQWSNVAGFARTGQYFDGSTTKDFPDALKAWLLLGKPDAQIFNLWNNVPAACFSDSCSTAEAESCCSAVITCKSQCCASRSAAKSGVCLVR